MSDGCDQELARRAAKGDADAFARLLERHYDRIHRLAWRLTGSRVDAEDVAQEVCVKLATAIRRFRGESEVGSWIWRIAYNAAADVMRSRRRLKPLEPSAMLGLMEAGAGDLTSGADAAWMANGTTTPEDAMAGHELWQAVRRLPGQQRDAILLVYGEDMSHAEAATVMGCTEKTVSWHVHEARKRLKAMLVPAADGQPKANQETTGSAP